MNLEDTQISTFMTKDTIKQWFNAALLLFGLRNYEFAVRLFIRIKKRCRRCGAKELKSLSDLFIQKTKHGGIVHQYENEHFTPENVRKICKQNSKLMKLGEEFLLLSNLVSHRFPHKCTNSMLVFHVVLLVLSWDASSKNFFLTKSEKVTHGRPLFFKKPDYLQQKIFLSEFFS